MSYIRFTEAMRTVAQQQQLMQAMQQLAELTNARRRVVRDEQGRVVGSEPA